MPSKYRMTEEELRAFKAYVVPDPVCIHGPATGEEALASREMQKALADGDTFVIRGNDRLKAATRQREDMGQVQKFNIAILDIPVLHLRSGASEELMRYIISDVMLQIQACIDRGKAEYLKKRVASGLRAAREKGMLLGRRALEKPPEYEKAYAAWRRGELSARKAAESLGVSHMTFLKWAKEG